MEAMENLLDLSFSHQTVFAQNDAKKKSYSLFVQKFGETITFLGAKIEKFFYKKWTLFVAV